MTDRKLDKILDKITDYLFAIALILLGVIIFSYLF